MKTFPAGKLPHADLAHLLAAYTHSHPRLVVPPALGEDAAVIALRTRARARRRC